MFALCILYSKNKSRSQDKKIEKENTDKNTKGENMRRNKTNTDRSEIFRTCPHRPWGPPSLLYNVHLVSFPGVKRPGSGVDHPPRSCTEVKERVELYLYALSGLPWSVLR
jgi:hypothetical protein